MALVSRESSPGGEKPDTPGDEHRSGLCSFPDGVRTHFCSELFSFRLGIMPETPEWVVVGPQSIEDLQNIFIWREVTCALTVCSSVGPTYSGSTRP
jgi:hypothetical protein